MKIFIIQNWVKIFLHFAFSKTQLTNKSAYSVSDNLCLMSLSLIQQPPEKKKKNIMFSHSISAKICGTLISNATSN